MDHSHLKMRISRMFHSSLVSCRSKNVSDLIQNPVFMPHEQSRRDFNYNVIVEGTPSSMAPYSLSSICKPKCSTKIIQKDRNALAHRHHRKKVSDRGEMYVVSGDTDDGRVCPPTSPTPTPVTTAAKSLKKKKKKPRTKKKERSLYRLLMSSSGGDNSDQSSGWFSSDDQDEDGRRNRDEPEKCFFSSNSVSTSDSSDQYYKRKKKKKGNGSGKMGRRIRVNDSSLLNNGGSTVKGKVEESVAVVKRSSDPKGDFRDSMVEMIVEKQLFGSKDLEELLQCFLYLNPAYHHKVIVEVFWEIWEALFVP
ncbi:hypothetical protein Sjap_019914 [Stephania japonica]|uniref:Transcription repressor n=1 Tax=Stephania japonica TaxID=461633 RepID=A0AAP0HZZ5_9MAGN